jgi:alpha-glucosidase
VTQDRNARIATSPMIARTDYPGPTQFADDGHGGITTAALALSIDPPSLCMAVADRRRAPPSPLTTLCPTGLADASPSFTLSQEATQHLYGLGEHFLTPGQPNGDLLSQTIDAGDEFGNALTRFNGGNTGNARFPIVYALGGAGQQQQYALFLDQQYAQSWDFSRSPWQVHMSGGALRGYVLAAAPDPLALRRQYMDLVGHPPVPPKKMFGLWVSEFGYDDWAELEDKLRTLRANGFPVDGFVLDLQWFGGVFRRPSRIGALSFDTAKFPDPAGEIVRLRDQQGIGLMLIEEPYVDVSQPIYADLAVRGALPLAWTVGPVDCHLGGHGSMLDWTSPHGDYWHDASASRWSTGVLGH